MNPVLPPFFGPDMSGFTSWHAAIIVAIIVLGIWSTVWKAFALYRAGVNQSPGWFVCLLIFNTVGILEILYLFVFGKKKSSPEAPVYQAPPAN